LNICACIGVLAFLSMLVNVVVMSAVTMRLYMSYNQCFHSQYNHLTEKIIDEDKVINRINFDIVTGFVNVKRTDDKKIVVRVYDKIRDNAHLDKKTFDSGIEANLSVINVHSITPAFSCKTCQHSVVEILIPRSYPHAIAISGLVKMGSVKIVGDITKNLGNIDVVVELGYIQARNILSPSVTLTTEVGVIKTYSSIIQNVKLLAHTGAIETDDLLSHNVHSVVQYGCSKHFGLTADNIKVDTKFGFSKVYEPSTLGKELDLTVNTEYGNAVLIIDSDRVTFDLGTTKRHMVVEYEDESFLCTMNNDTSPVHINGKCSVLPATKESDKSSVAKIHLNTKYGNSALVVDHFEEDDD